MVEQWTTLFIFAFSRSGICWPPLTEISHIENLLKYTPLVITLKSNSLRSARKQANKQANTTTFWSIMSQTLEFLCVGSYSVTVCKLRFSWEVYPEHSAFILMSVMWIINGSLQKMMFAVFTHCNSRDSISQKIMAFAFPYMWNIKNTKTKTHETEIHSQI